MLAQLLGVSAHPLLRTALPALAAAAARFTPAAAQALQQRTCQTHHRLSSAPDDSQLDSHVRALSSLAAQASLPVVRSEDSTAACGELPTSSYAGGAFSGLWQHGEARHILYSDEHSSVTNELEKLLLVADEAGGPEAVFKVVEQFGEGPDWGEMNIATAFHCLAHTAAGMSAAAVQRQILDHPVFGRLADEASSRAAQMTDAELGEVGRACAALHYSDSKLVEQIHWRELDNCQALEPYDAATTAECMAGAI